MFHYIFISTDLYSWINSWSNANDHINNKEGLSHRGYSREIYCSVFLHNVSVLRANGTCSFSQKSKKNQLYRYAVWLGAYLGFSLVRKKSVSYPLALTFKSSILHVNLHDEVKNDIFPLLFLVVLSLWHWKYVWRTEEGESTGFFYEQQMQS